MFYRLILKRSVLFILKVRVANFEVNLKIKSYHGVSIILQKISDMVRSLLSEKRFDSVDCNLLCVGKKSCNAKWVAKKRLQSWESKGFPNNWWPWLDFFWRIMVTLIWVISIFRFTSKSAIPPFKGLLKLRNLKICLLITSISILVDQHFECPHYQSEYFHPINKILLKDIVF